MVAYTLLLFPRIGAEASLKSIDIIHSWFHSENNSEKVARKSYCFRWDNFAFLKTVSMTKYDRWKASAVKSINVYPECPPEELEPSLNKHSKIFLKWTFRFYLPLHPQKCCVTTCNSHLCMPTHDDVYGGTTTQTTPLTTTPTTPPYLKVKEGEFDFDEHS